MNSLGDFHFIRPAWLLLAPVATWLWWRVRALRKIPCGAGVK